MSNISEQLHGEKQEKEHNDLVEDQLRRQEALDQQFSQQEREAVRELDKEVLGQKEMVDNEINQQLKLVSNILISCFLGLLDQCFKKGFHIEIDIT